MNQIFFTIMRLQNIILLIALLLWAPLLMTTGYAEKSSDDPVKNLSVKEKFDNAISYFESEYGPEEARQLNALKEELIAKGHDEDVVQELLSEAELNTRVAELFRENLLRSTDAGDVTYEDFAGRIDLQDLKEKSHQFVEDHKQELLDAEETYGVDYRYIVGIKGIETRYGADGMTGDYVLLNSLVTQYVLSNRKTFSVRELDAVLKLNQKYNAEIQHAKGSFAGAVGVAQWMPFSLLHYAVLEDIDDIQSTHKMIPSTANYLRENGWRPSLNGEPIERGSPNWNAIRRYNHSDTYVQVVIDIAEQIER